MEKIQIGRPVFEESWLVEGKRTEKKNMSKTKTQRTAIPYFPGGIYNDDKGSSSSAVFMVVAFINQYTKNVYHYTTLDIPTFFWNTSHILFSNSGIATSLKGWFSEPLFERWGAENMSFPSRDWTLYFFSYDYILPRKTE